MLGPAQEDYKEDVSIMDALLEHVVNDIDFCSTEGVKLKCGEQLHLIPLGNKGDWSYLVLCLCCRRNRK